MGARGGSPGSTLPDESGTAGLTPFPELDADAHAANPSPTASANIVLSRQKPERIPEGYLTKHEGPGCRGLAGHRILAWAWSLANRHCQCQKSCYECAELTRLFWQEPRTI